MWTENILKKEFFKKADANIRIIVYSVRGDELLLRPVISYFHSIRFSSIFQHSGWDNSVEKKKLERLDYTFFFIFQHSRWDNSAKKARKTWFGKQWYIWVSMVDLVKSDSGTEFASNGVCMNTLQKVQVKISYLLSISYKWRTVCPFLFFLWEIRSVW